MGFDLTAGGGFSFGGGFSMTQKPENPLDKVEYIGDLEADSLAELEALRAAMVEAEPAADLVLVFPDREALEGFMTRRHLSKDSRFIDHQKAVRALSVKAGDGAGFSLGGGFSPKPKREVDADEGWVQRAKAEKDRFKLATDPEYYCVITFPDSTALQMALNDLGLSGVEPLDIPGATYLSGPVVDSTL